MKTEKRNGAVTLGMSMVFKWNRAHAHAYRAVVHESHEAHFSVDDGDVHLAMRARSSALTQAWCLCQSQPHS
jgi:hypothetical protein